MQSPKLPSFAFDDGIPFVNPICLDVVLNVQKLLILESHLIQCFEGRSYIGAFVKWAAAAVNDHVGIGRYRL
jgi:hypothetical protein